jgi:hypothetical protein
MLPNAATNISLPLLLSSIIPNHQLIHISLSVTRCRDCVTPLWISRILKANSTLPHSPHFAASLFALFTFTPDTLPLASSPTDIHALT